MAELVTIVTQEAPPPPPPLSGIQSRVLTGAWCRPAVPQDRALPIALKTGSEASRLRLCHKLVDLLLSLRRHDDAVEFAQTALDISITLGERGGVVAL